MTPMASYSPRKNNLKWREIVIKILPVRRSCAAAVARRRCRPGEAVVVVALRTDVVHTAVAVDPQNAQTAD